MAPFVCTPSILQELPLFSRVPEPQLATLARSVKRRTYNRRTIIIGSQSATTGLYIILSGQARVVLEDDRGRQVVLAELKPSDMFGELGLLLESVSNEVVEATSDCEVIYVPRERLLECLEGSPETAIHMLNVVAE